MAPEALSMNPQKKSDLWSCGVILFEALVDRRPFNASNFDELREQLTSDAYRTPRVSEDVAPVRTNEFLDVLLSQNPSERGDAKCLAATFREAQWSDYVTVSLKTVQNASGASASLHLNTLNKHQKSPTSVIPSARTDAEPIKYWSVRRNEEDAACRQRPPVPSRFQRRRRAE